MGFEGRQVGRDDSSGNKGPGASNDVEGAKEDTGYGQLAEEMDEPDVGQLTAECLLKGLPGEGWLYGEELRRVGWS